MVAPLTHIEARAIGAFDLMLRSQIQIDRRMAERAAAAIAGDDLGLDGDDLERLHETGFPKLRAATLGDAAPDGETGVAKTGLALDESSAMGRAAVRDARADLG